MCFPTSILNANGIIITYNISNFIKYITKTKQVDQDESHPSVVPLLIIDMPKLRPGANQLRIKQGKIHFSFLRPKSTMKNMERVLYYFFSMVASEQYMTLPG